MKKYRQSIVRIFLGVFLCTLMLTTVPPQALAAVATLELINNQPETVKVAFSSWDADQNQSYTKGWITLKPNTTTTITIEHYGDWEQVLWLYATSHSRVWQGDPNANLSDPDIWIAVNTINNFQYWGPGGNYTNQNGWETVYGFSIRENGTHGSFSYTF